VSPGPVEALAHRECDAVSIGELVGVEAVQERLSRAGVPSEKIVSLLPKA